MCYQIKVYITFICYKNAHRRLRFMSKGLKVNDTMIQKRMYNKVKNTAVEYIKPTNKFVWVFLSVMFLSSVTMVWSVWLSTFKSFKPFKFFFNLDRFFMNRLSHWAHQQTGYTIFDDFYQNAIAKSSSCYYSFVLYLRLWLIFSEFKHKKIRKERISNSRNFSTNLFA